MRADGTRVRNVTRSASWDSGVDWGRAGIPPGHDFPDTINQSYNLTPGEIFAAALADPMANLIQINHVASFFGSETMIPLSAKVGNVYVRHGWTLAGRGLLPPGP